MNGQRTSGTATVMFTDVEASTDITTRLGDDAAAALLAAHDTVVLEQVSAYGGRDVRSTGDGFLVVFDSARAGVSCALSIQRELADREPAIRVRIGLNAGEVLEGAGEPFGAAINLAARVMDRADGGEILTTDTVRQLVGTLTDASFRDRGRVALKGFEERQRLYEVRPADSSSAQRPAPRPPPHRLSRRARTLLGTLIVAGAAAIAVAVAVGRGGAPPVSVPANSVAVIDPRAGSVLAAIPVGENPGPVSAGAGGVWVLNLDSASVSRIDVGTRRVVETRGFGGTPGTGGTPGNVSASRSEVWVHGGGCNGDTPGVLLHAFTGGADLRGDDDQALAGVLHPHSTPAGSVGGCALVAGGRSAWLGLNGGEEGIARFDYAAATGRSRLVWAHPSQRVPVALAVGFGSLWSVIPDLGVVRRIDPATGRATARIPVGTDPVAIAPDANALWVANAGDNSVSRIDPRTNRVTRTIAVGHRPQGVAVAGGLVWVTVRE